MIMISAMKKRRKDLSRLTIASATTPCTDLSPVILSLMGLPLSKLLIAEVL